MGAVGSAIVVAIFPFFLNSGSSLRAASPDYMYQFNDAFSGTAPASPVKPWIDATFQTVTPGTVRLMVTNMTLTGLENVDGLYFNLNSNLLPSKLSFKLIAESGAFNTPKISTGGNKFQADGDGKYDILFSFNNGGTANNRFTAHESMTYYISGIPTLTAADFSYLSAPAGGAGPFFAAAHVQRIGLTASSSGWLSATDKTPLLVPEPSSKSLLLLGIWAWVAVFLHKRARASCPVKEKLQLVRVPLRRQRYRKLDR